MLLFHRPGSTTRPASNNRVWKKNPMFVIIVNIVYSVTLEFKDQLIH